MKDSVLVGVFFHWLGGLSAASAYVPYRAVRSWSWEVFWLTGMTFNLLLVPWLMAGVQTSDLLVVLSHVPFQTVFACVGFGLLWGFGGLTYGLTMRYLGLSLGMAVVLGLCTVFGTLIPPLFAGDFAQKLLMPVSGRIVLLGVGITVLGIVVVAAAGASKERATSLDQNTAAIAEFNFSKGIWVAIFSGVMSACFAFGITAGHNITPLSVAAGTNPLWAGLPAVCLVMLGGLITNAACCLYLVRRNRRAGEWIGLPAPIGAQIQDAGVRHPPSLVRNYLLCALAGTVGYFQFFFYTMGESRMGNYRFSSWTLHMASIIIFGTIWGLAFREWKDATLRVRSMVFLGVGLLVLATIVIGYGTSRG
jgi:L-rhamnose-H+ transport protein